MVQSQVTDSVGLPDDGVEERVRGERKNRCGLFWIGFFGRVLRENVRWCASPRVTMTHSGVDWDILARHEEGNEDSSQGQKGDLCP